MTDTVLTGYGEGGYGDDGYGTAPPIPPTPEPTPEPTFATSVVVVDGPVVPVGLLGTPENHLIIYSQ